MQKLEKRSFLAKKSIVTIIEPNQNFNAEGGSQKISGQKHIPILSTSIDSVENTKQTTCKLVATSMKKQTARNLDRRL